MRGASGASSSSVPFKEDGGKKETDALVVAHNRANASREDGGFDSPQHAPKPPLRYYADEEKATEKEGEAADDEEERSPFYYKVPLSPRNLGVNDRRFDEKDWRRNGVLHLLACATANVISLGAYGVLQQRIMTIPYGGFVDEEGNEVSAVFTSSIFLVFSNRLFSLLFGMVALAYTKPERVSLFSREWWWPHSSMENYMYVASSNLVSTLCQYEVLKYLSFALSTLAKAAKILPTMLWGYILHGKRFQSSQYLSAIIVTTGCFVFVFNSSVVIQSSSSTASSSSQLLPQAFKAVYDDNYDSITIGVGILLVYLAADGFTSSFQQRLFRVQKTSLFDQMFWMCVFGTIFSGVWLVCSGQLMYSLTFLRRHRKICQDIAILSLCSAFSQIAITYTIRAFGAVTLASIVTVRQVVSIVLNSFVYHEKLVPLQWFGMGLIVLPALFGGDWYRKELERGDRSHSTWDLKKLSTDPVASEKKPDGREHFYRVPTFQTFSFAAKGAAPSTRERDDENG